MALSAHRRDVRGKDPGNWGAQKKKTLVVYYSKFGNTRKVA
jgi:hypothetical protein